MRESIDEEIKLNDKFETHRIIFNFTENTLELYQNETNIAFKVDNSIVKTPSVLKNCELSLVSKGISTQTKASNICSAIYSFYCNVNCNIND